MSLGLCNDALFTDEELGFRSGNFPRSLGRWVPRGIWRTGSGSRAVVTGRVPSNASLWRRARRRSCSGKSSGSCRVLLSHRVLVGRSDPTVWFWRPGEGSHRGVISEALRGHRAVAVLFSTVLCWTHLLLETGLEPAAGTSRAWEILTPVSDVLSYQSFPIF